MSNGPHEDPEAKNMVSKTLRESLDNLSYLSPAKTLLHIVEETDDPNQDRFHPRYTTSIESFQLPLYALSGLHTCSTHKTRRSASTPLLSSTQGEVPMVFEELFLRTKAFPRLSLTWIDS